jgi:hypothetical protein
MTGSLALAHLSFYQIKNLVRGNDIAYVTRHHNTPILIRKCYRLAFPAGIEPAAPSLGNLCSILLSYGNKECNCPNLSDIDVDFVAFNVVTSRIGNIHAIHGQAHLGQSPKNAFGIAA